MIFLFLIYRAMYAARQSSRLMLRAVGAVRRRRWGAQAPEPAPQVVIAIAPREILRDRLAGRSVPHSPVLRRAKTGSAPAVAEARA
jgi:hypothetical protein